MRYRLFRPVSPATNQLYPLVLILHGGGADNDFDQLLNCASPFFAFGPARFISAAEQARHPSFVLVPWSGGRGWQEENCRLIMALLEALRREMSIDPRRIYVTGQSMGGYGTWRLLEKYPAAFAAGIPVCGGGEPALAARAKGLSLWAFHGTGDQIVPVTESRRMIAAFQQAGGKARYWEYEGEDHADTARRAYCEPGLTDWLFAQVKP
jgi:predicted peptidase